MTDEKLITISIRDNRTGGQTFGTNHGVVCVRSEMTGVYIEVPCSFARSSWRARTVALEALEYITGERP